MKKNILFCAGLCAVLAFSSCKSSESAYKKAYEKAKAQEQAQNNSSYNNDTPVVTPVVDQPATQTTVVDNTDNVPVRSERVTIVNGAGIKSFSVVVGSFSLKANAESLLSRLRSSGYDAQLGFNQDRNMYRVISSTFDNKADAVRSRDQFRATYPDAWLLFKH